jgi:hypothetical protein
MLPGAVELREPLGSPNNFEQNRDHYYAHCCGNRRTDCGKDHGQQPTGLVAAFRDAAIVGQLIEIGGLHSRIRRVENEKW